MKRVSIIAVVGVASLLSSTRVRAEDTKGKWQFGFGLSYFSTVDYIRSNADLAVASGVVGTEGLPPVSSVDERPDINILNQASIRDDFKLDFNASYGLTRWLALEGAVSYMNAPVGNIEFYSRKVNQGLTGSPTDSTLNLDERPACGPDLSSHCWSYTSTLPDDRRSNHFMPVGTLREIPVHLSGLVRFRPESPFDPYIGLGFGFIKTQLKTGDEFNQTAAFFGDPKFRATTADEGEYNLTTRCNRVNGEACSDFHPGPLEANVKDSWEWHAVGGVDYYMSDKMSVYVDARYVWTSGSVDIRTDDAHQVRFGVTNPGGLVIRKQGKNGLDYDPNNPDTWYLWEDTNIQANLAFHQLCPACLNDGYLETEDKNANGALESACSIIDGVPTGFCEDEGWLYELPPGTRQIDEALRIPCAGCAHNNHLDTEDANGNGFLDRYLLYGIDICSTSEGVGNPACANRTLSNTNNYVWPEGCVQKPEQLLPFATIRENGCPPFPLTNAGTIPSGSDVGNTGADNSADTYIIQGGRIRMGGFSLGVGFKFTF